MTNIIINGTKHKIIGNRLTYNDLIDLSGIENPTKISFKTPSSVFDDIFNTAYTMFNVEPNTVFHVTASTPIKEDLPPIDIIINGAKIKVYEQSLTYEHLVALALGCFKEGYKVFWQYRSSDYRVSSGRLTIGSKIKINSGMEFLIESEKVEEDLKQQPNILNIRIFKVINDGIKLPINEEEHINAWCGDFIFIRDNKVYAKKRIEKNINSIYIETMLSPCFIIINDNFFNEVI
jgi:hypothetical protein